MGRDQHGLHGDLNPALESLAVLHHQVDQANQAFDLLGGGGSPEGPGGESGHDLAGDFAVVPVIRAPEDDLPMRLGKIIGEAIKRPDDLQRLDGQVPVAVGGVGEVGIPGVIGEGDGEPIGLILGLDLHPGLIDGRGVLLGLDLEGLGGLSVDPELHPGQIFARLLAEGPGPEDVGPAPWESPIDPDLGIGGHQPEARAAVDAAAFFLRHGRGLPSAGRPVGLAVGQDGFPSDGLGGGQVLLQQEGREGQHVADVVEAVTHVVGREIVGRSEVDPDQVPDRVVVFLAIEPAERDPSRVLRDLATRLRGEALEIVDDL